MILLYSLYLFALVDHWCWIGYITLIVTYLTFNDTVMIVACFLLCLTLGLLIII